MWGWLFGSLWYSAKVGVAGLWPLIWHFGIPGLILIACVFLLVSPLIPVVGTVLGPLTRPFRKELVIVIAVLSAMIWYAGLLVQDERNRCKAQTEVIKTTVDKIVIETAPDTSAPEHHMDDPWDRPEY